MTTKKAKHYTKKELRRLSELLLVATELVDEITELRILKQDCPPELQGLLISTVIMLKLRIVAHSWPE